MCLATKCLLSAAVVANMHLTWQASLHAKPTERGRGGGGAADDGKGKGEGLDGRQGSADSGQLSLSLTRAIRASGRDVVKHYCTQSVDRAGKSGINLVEVEENPSSFSEFQFHEKC